MILINTSLLIFIVFIAIEEKLSQANKLLQGKDWELKNKSRENDQLLIKIRQLTEQLTHLSQVFMCSVLTLTCSGSAYYSTLSLTQSSSDMIAHLKQKCDDLQQKCSDLTEQKKITEKNLMLEHTTAQQLLKQVNSLCYKIK